MQSTTVEPVHTEPVPEGNAGNQRPIPVAGRLQVTPIAARIRAIGQELARQSAASHSEVGEAAGGVAPAEEGPVRMQATPAISPNIARMMAQPQRLQIQLQVRTARQDDGGVFAEATGTDSKATDTKATKSVSHESVSHDRSHPASSPTGGQSPVASNASTAEPVERTKAASTPVAQSQAATPLPVVTQTWLDSLNLVANHLAQLYITERQAAIDAGEGDGWVRVEIPDPAGGPPTVEMRFDDKAFKASFVHRHRAEFEQLASHYGMSFDQLVEQHPDILDIILNPARGTHGMPPPAGYLIAPPSPSVVTKPDTPTPQPVPSKPDNTPVVTQTWLDSLNLISNQIALAYITERQAAIDAGEGDGWVRVEIPDPAGGPPTVEMRFDDKAFKASFVHRHRAEFEQLASHYGMSFDQLVEQHPDILDIILNPARGTHGMPPPEGYLIAPPAVQPAPAPSPAAPAPAPVAGSPAAPAPAPGDTATPVVTQTWLDSLNLITNQIALLYATERQSAIDAGAGPGWVRVEIPDPAGGPPTVQMRFDEQAFREHFMHQHSALFEQLASHYGMSFAQLLEKHPDIVDTIVNLQRGTHGMPPPEGYLIAPPSAPGAPGTDAPGAQPVVTQTWLDSLNLTADAVRAQYRVDRDAAIAAGQGAGWEEYTYEETSIETVEGGEGGTTQQVRTETRTGRRFNETLFQQQYLQNHPGALDALAAHYGMTGAQLVHQHPEILSTILTPHRDPHALPPPEGYAIAAPGVGPQGSGPDGSGPPRERSVTQTWLDSLSLTRSAMSEAYRADLEAARQQAAAAGQPFDERAFLREWPSRHPESLQALADHYDMTIEELVAAYPDIVADALNGNIDVKALPAPQGFCMAPPAQLEAVDQFLTNPELMALMAADTEPVDADNAVAREQIQLYGRERFEQMVKADRAMARVRADYEAGLAQAQAQGHFSTARTVSQQIWQDEPGTGDSGSGRYVTVTHQENVFDPDAFTAWYLTQDTPEARLFKQFFGASTTTSTTNFDENGVATGQTVSTTFEHGPWQMVDGRWKLDGAVAKVDASAPPDLHNTSAVWFDPAAGWITASQNIDRGRNWVRIIATVVVIVVVSVVTYGAASGALGTSFWGVVGAGAAAGAASAAASGLMNGDLSWEGVLKGAIIGAITAGLVYGAQMDSVGLIVRDLGKATATAGQMIRSIITRALINGSVAEMSGGSFKSAVVGALVQGAADWLAGQLPLGESDTDLSGRATPVDSAADKVVRQFLHSLLTSAVSEQDFEQAFVESFLGGTIATYLQPLVMQEFAAKPARQQGAGGPQDSPDTPRSGNAPSSKAGPGRSPDTDGSTAPAFNSKTGTPEYDLTKGDWASMPPERDAAGNPVAPPSGPDGRVPMPSLSEAGFGGLIERQASGDPPLNAAEIQQLNAANYIREQRAINNGGGGHIVRDDYGNVRTFDLNRDNEITLHRGETVQEAWTYRGSDGEVVIVQTPEEIPADATDSLKIREKYYGDQCIGRDFGTTPEYASEIAKHSGTLGGDPAESIRRQVVVPTTGPYSVLSRYVDPGSGQVNPLLWNDFKNEAIAISVASGEPARLVLTTNGMMNSYQQAYNNANVLAGVIPNALVVNVFNPSTDSQLFDGLEATQTLMGQEQTVSTAMRAQIEEASAFQAESTREINKIRGKQGLTELATPNVLAVGHSQGTINLGAAIGQLSKDFDKRGLDVVYIGTAVATVPKGVGNFLNIVDANDKVSNVTGGAQAIDRTFNPPGYETNGELYGSRAANPIPANYNVIRTNFELDVSQNSGLVSGNNHSFYVYFQRPEVQTGIRNMINTPAEYQPISPVPTFTQAPAQRAMA